MNLTQLRNVMPRAPEVWLMALTEQLPLSGIDAPNEIASFIAQVAHESREFTRLEEDLHYSAARLQEVWPARFKDLSVAKSYALNPERLANFVYANRMGNGNEVSGDGWKFHGRGPIQLTGRSNYRAFAVASGHQVELYPEQLVTPSVGVASAIWFWEQKGLDAVDDDADVTAETKAVNGGLLGLEARQAYFDKALFACSLPKAA